jgi:hypothetical protein
VLLDEADVFLEERTVSDQKQNAIVSGKYRDTPEEGAKLTRMLVQSYYAFSNTTMAY